MLNRYSLRVKKSITIPALLCITLANAYGQQSVMGNIPGKLIDVKTGSNAVVTQLAMAPPTTNGDVYLHSDWALANITLSDEKTQLTGYPVKLDLKTNNLEIRYDNQVKLLPARRIREFVLLRNNGVREKFVNASKYVLNESPIEGFLHVVDTGKWALLKKTDLKMIESSYNAALDVGQRDHRLVKDERSFFSRGNTLYEIDLSLKKFCKQFIGHESAISKFIKEEKLSLKKADDLHALLVFLNTHI